MTLRCVVDTLAPIHRRILRAKVTGASFDRAGVSYSDCLRAMQHLRRVCAITADGTATPFGAALLAGSGEDR